MALRAEESIYHSQKVQNVQILNHDEWVTESFKQRLREIEWEEIKKCEDPNETYKDFSETFIKK